MFGLLEPPVIDWLRSFASATVAIHALRLDILGDKAAKPYSMRTRLRN